jgi:asparagine synthase (glutamine-hydrolysing)
VQVGEGSDELFAGYTGYAFMADFYRKWYAPFSRLPPFVKSPLALLAGSFLPERKASYLHMAAEDRELFWGGANVFSDNKKKHLLRERVVFDTYESVISRHYDKFDTRRPGADFVDRIIYLELKQRLAELLLMRVDKMTMATSVESRVPYLDHELVRFALSIPSKFKIHNGTTKSILKKAARGIIPDTVIDRPKTGFCGSATNMVRGPLFDHAQRSVMGSSWLQEIMRTERLIPFFAEHRSGKRDRGMAIWCLLNLVEWHKVWME